MENTLIIPEDILNKAYWIPNDLRQPDVGDFYFVIIEDRDGLIKDIQEATDKKHLTHGQCCWEQLDSRKYSENAKVVYWLDTRR